MTDKEKKELEVSKKKTIEKESGEPTREGVMYIPEVDIIEDDEGITLLADLPGVKRENVEIDVREGVLTLTATVEPVPGNWQPLLTEYEIGGYTRRFNLSERIDQEKIGATMDNGVLTLVLPKAEAAKPRKIDIT